MKSQSMHKVDGIKQGEWWEVSVFKDFDQINRGMDLWTNLVLQNV